MTPRVALTIAGSDSGGGAGVQADLRCFAALGVYGTCAITAVTAQNTVGVQAVHGVPPRVVDAQIAAVVDDLAPAAAKTGMIPTAAVMEAVAARFAKRPRENYLSGVARTFDPHQVVSPYGRSGSFLTGAKPDPPRLVVDPVMVTSSGHCLVDEGAQGAFLRLLFPLATVVTPNLGEAALLVGRPVSTLGEMAYASRRLHDSGPAVVVITGGHLAGSESVDVAFDGHDITLLRAPRLHTRNLHGTGCTFSAAITAYLALGLAPFAAIAAAKDFVNAAIRGATNWSLGTGSGPLDPFGWDS